MISARKAESHAAIVGRGIGRLANFPQDPFAKPFPSTDHGEADVLTHDLGPFLDDVLFEEPHEKIDFPLRPLPILAAEAIQAQLFDADAGAILDDGPHAGHSPAMAFDAGEASPLRPASVSIHDDRDMPRKPVARNSGEFEGIDHGGSAGGHGVGSGINLKIAVCLGGGYVKAAVILTGFAARLNRAYEFRPNDRGRNGKPERENPECWSNL